MNRASTLGALVAAGLATRPVKDELRTNLLALLRAGKETFPGIVGYERTVLPQLHNAILARHDFILLGLRGQGKSRLLRSLPGLLDAAIPAIDGCPINDDPFAPQCKRCRRLAPEAGNDLPLRWLTPDERFAEKLATPDVTMADLIGDIDPIKAANERRSFADDEVINFGLVPRANRGIFAVNELPDLAPRIQVGLFDILEEREVQIRGFSVRLPLDVLLVFSANPEDYTSRGKIVTPLKDRIDAEIRTHYPADVATAVRITAQEAWTERGAAAGRVEVPQLFRELVEEIAGAARESELVDQTSGVSARMSISALEALVSNLERRALATGDDPVLPRLCDLQACLPAITGKVEFVYEGEQQGPELIARKLVGQAVRNLFARHYPAIERPGAARAPSGNGGGSGPYQRVLDWFAAGGVVTVSDEQPFAEYSAALAAVDGLADLVRGVKTPLPGLPPASPGAQALAAELVLEGLSQSLRLARQDLDSHVSYAEMVKFNLLRH